MVDYKAPLRDIRFVREELLDQYSVWESLEGCEDATKDMIDAIMEEAGKFAENELAPLNKIGDQQGCVRDEQGEVKTPDGFKEAYDLYVEGGWPTITSNVEYGGQGLPASLGSALQEVVQQANWSWSMYPGLSHGAKHTLEEWGSDEQKAVYLTKLVEGQWTGTMCLTEPHCGTDLGMLKTKAEPQADGSYKLTGTKIFISSGEHDLAENIVHIVIARTPDAPAGTKGISLFVVPKFLPDANGEKGERNGVVCGSLEHKMGIHGNSTCVMNFDGATGFLIGEVNKGMRGMFTFMNTARVGTAFQGVAHGEIAYQGALAYAKDRLQMRALSGPKNPQGPADPIIVHPDVRRMLLTIKAFTEGSRAMAHFLSLQIDIAERAKTEEERKQAEDTMALLTPIAKAFMTEVGFESANHGMQVYGGHGYISEWGMEQNVRDCRISMMYEGTTGIQALDLLGRKVMGSGGELLKGFTKTIHKFCKEHEGNETIGTYVEELARLNKEWGEITMAIGGRAMENPEEVGAASVDYLMYSGYTSIAYFWARMALVAKAALDAGTTEVAYYQAKLNTCDFYFKRILPRTRGLVATMNDNSQSLMTMSEDEFDAGY